MVPTPTRSIFDLERNWPLLIVVLFVVIAGTLIYKKESDPAYIKAKNQMTTPHNERMFGHEAVLPDELKGCKVFRLFDGKKSLYLTSCTDTVTTEWTESCGKNCFRQESVTTQRRGDI